MPVGGDPNKGEQNSPKNIISIAALAVALISLLILVFAGLGNHWQLWGFRTGISMLRWDFYIGIIGIVLSVIAIILLIMKKQRVTKAIISLLIGIVVVASLLKLYGTAKSVPPIHDITTDTSNPPQFVAVLPLRSHALNPATYGGPEIAAQQQKAFSDITTLHFKLSPSQAFDRALNVAKSMRWQIVATDSAQGRIEATATTKWFGFKDDVVIRIEPESNTSKLDIRSVSRVGKGDLGTNAKRVRIFMSKFGQQG